jgi:hypothetical protein
VDATGALDLGFNPNADIAVANITVQTDGQILVGGWFTSVGGTPRIGIVRVAADGTLDASFDPNLNGIVLGVAVQPDGKILIGGGFINVGGTSRNCLARLNLKTGMEVSGHGCPAEWLLG